MLRVTIDAFSGLPNPTWILDEKDTQELLKDLTRNRSVVSDIDTGHLGLGYRGVIIESLADDVQESTGLPPVMRIANGSSMNEAKGLEIAERLIRAMGKYAPASKETDGWRYDASLEGMLLKQLERFPIGMTPPDLDGPPAIEKEALVLPKVCCPITLCAFNPGFWNGQSHITKNNCYNYASNKRTDTFAQPGKGSGHPITQLTCADVTRAALADGLHRRFDCFPSTEQPIWLVALVVAPNYDYHWYRKSKEGFWGHKPGRTAAKNTDNNGAVIMNPETCARGPYTDFCGYMYVPKSQKIS